MGATVAAAAATTVATAAPAAVGFISSIACILVIPSATTTIVASTSSAPTAPIHSVLTPSLVAGGTIAAAGLISAGIPTFTCRTPIVPTAIPTASSPPRSSCCCWSTFRTLALPLALIVRTPIRSAGVLVPGLPLAAVALWTRPRLCYSPLLGLAPFHPNARPTVTTVGRICPVCGSNGTAATTTTAAAATATTSSTTASE